MQRDDNGGAVVLFHQPRGHDADDAGVPPLARDDQHAVALAGRVGFKRFLRGSEHFLFGLLALGVDLGQAGSDTCGLGFVGAKQQFQRYSGVIHAARCVQAWGQAVADRVRRDGLARNTGVFHQRLQTRAHRVLQKRQALTHKGAVLPHKRHHIGHSAKRDQLAVHLKQIGGRAALERGAEFERHARAAQILERAFIVGPLGVDHRNGIGQGFAGQVVVGHDKVKPQFFGAGCFLDG